MRHDGVGLVEALFWVLAGGFMAWAIVGMLPAAAIAAGLAAEAALLERLSVQLRLTWARLDERMRALEAREDGLSNRSASRAHDVSGARSG